MAPLASDQVVARHVAQWSVEDLAELVVLQFQLVREHDRCCPPGVASLDKCERSFWGIYLVRIEFCSWFQEPD